VCDIGHLVGMLKDAGGEIDLTAIGIAQSCRVE
jgi:hypothetical protein